jgi:energy-coupling factor transport system permease protein
LSTRLRNVTRVLIPLLLGTLDRIEAVSSAMELRGFGRGKKRTWYGEEPLRARDVVTMLGALALVAVAVGLLAVNGGRYWNPFV